jgi:hypothetical protein
MTNEDTQVKHLPHGHVFIRNGLVYRVSLEEVVVTDEHGKESVFTTEEHYVVGASEAYTELERIRLKSMT